MLLYNYSVVKKNSTLNNILNTITETNKYNSFNNICLRYKTISLYCFHEYWNIKQNREVANCVYKDMLGMVQMWRQIRGYPTTGATTHTNAHTAKKNKLLFFYRINQFTTLFGNRKRNIYPTLLKAEYNNRLWFTNWLGEWLQASKFAIKMVKTQTRHGGFNPVLLADGQTNGYIRIGKASKISKAKKLVKLFTVGVPVFFTRFIYYERLPPAFPYRLLLKDDVNKKLGKKYTKKNK